MILRNICFLTSLFTWIVMTSSAKAQPRSLKSWWINSPECGYAKTGSRIVGGQEAAMGQYPWIARVAYDNLYRGIKFKCGASLINERYAITAAHCVHGLVHKIRFIRLGEHFANTTKDCDGEICAPPVQDLLVEKIIMHPKYDDAMVKHDIAIIRLKQLAVYNDYVKPICLPRYEMAKKNYVTERVEVAGWGIIDSSTEETSNTLLYVTLPIRDACACNKSLSALKIDSNQFCVGLDNGKDSCGGDSGGPMMKLERVANKRRYHLLGVVSVGRSYCGEAPAIYTNVIKYMDWISDTVGAQEYREAHDVPEQENNTL